MFQQIKFFMKGIISAVLFFALLTNAAFSQKLNLGIKAGTDLHKVTGKSFDEEFKFGYHIGAFAEFKIKKIGIQPEVYFSQVNAEQGNDASSIFNASHITEAKLSYLNIPIMVNYYFSPNVALGLGPQFGILVNETNTSNVVQTAEDAFKKGDFSIVTGLQIKLSRFRIYGRYVIGLNNINDVTDSETWKNKTIHLGVGFSIL
jgi:hypothetical protein